MFGWFAPRCPVSTSEKVSLESRLQLLADEFSSDRMLSAEVVLPTPQFFPEPFAGEESDARLIFQKVAAWMKVDVSEIELQILPDEEMPGAAGHYVLGEQKMIRVAASNLPDPLRLTATFTHELSHELLLGHRSSDRGTDDEWTTDLLPVFLGLGVFNANATVHESSGREGNVSWWSVGRSGYLTSRLYGYALALFAFGRNERSPSWAAYLRPDARSPFWQGLRYLQKTDDTLFHPRSMGQGKSEREPTNWAHELRHSLATRRLRALWKVGKEKIDQSDVVDAVLHCLRDTDRCVAKSAAWTLGELGDAVDRSGPTLLALWPKAAFEQRQAIIVALGKLRFAAAKVLPEAVRMLQDDTEAVRAAGVEALRGYGPEAKSAAPTLVDALIGDLVDCRDYAHTADALVAVTDDPKRSLRELTNLDRELARYAIAAIEEAIERRESRQAANVTPRTTS